jgi:hypothetical protein
VTRQSSVFYADAQKTGHAQSASGLGCQLLDVHLQGASTMQGKDFEAHTGRHCCPNRLRKASRNIANRNGWQEDCQIRNSLESNCTTTLAFVAILRFLIYFTTTSIASSKWHWQCALRSAGRPDLGVRPRCRTRSVATGWLRVPQNSVVRTRRDHSDRSQPCRGMHLLRLTP